MTIKIEWVQMDATTYVGGGFTVKQDFARGNWRAYEGRILIATRHTAMKAKNRCRERAEDRAAIARKNVEAAREVLLGSMLGERIAKINDHALGRPFTEEERSARSLATEWLAEITKGG